MLPAIAIVGRPNVGKSTLFNRLVRRQAAIAHDESGVTRDRIYAEGEVEGRDVAFIDTGGLDLDPAGSGGLSGMVHAQAMEAVAEAQAILLIMDGRQGLTVLDRDVARIVRQSGKPTLVVVNKVDGAEREDEMLAEFHELGLPLLAVSASHGHNIRALQEIIDQELLRDVPPPEDDETETGLRLAVLGRPNAGKSSLINALVGKERLIVSPMAGTTRDAVDVALERDGKRYTFVDTAGVRRKTKITEDLEHQSVLRALRASKRAQVTLLVVDVNAGITVQDKKLLSFLAREKTPFMLVVNKVDLVPPAERKLAQQHYEKELKICPWAPLVFTSTISGHGLAKVLPLAERIWAECQMRVSTGKLNQVMRDVLSRHQPPLVDGKRAKFYYLTQVDEAPPTFVFFVNNPDWVKVSYSRYLEGQLRKLFGMQTAPLRVLYRQSGGKDN